MFSPGREQPCTAGATALNSPRTLEEACAARRCARAHSVRRGTRTGPGRTTARRCWLHHRRRAARGRRAGRVARSPSGNAAHLALWPSGFRPRASGSRTQLLRAPADNVGMSRDPHELEAFVLADALVVDVYGATRSFPSGGALRSAGSASAGGGIRSGEPRRGIVPSFAARLPSLCQYRHRLCVGGALSGRARRAPPACRCPGWQTSDLWLHGRYPSVAGSDHESRGPSLRPEARSPRPGVLSDRHWS